MRDLIRLVFLALVSFAIVGAAMIYTGDGAIRRNLEGFFQSSQSVASNAIGTVTGQSEAVAVGEPDAPAPWTLRVARPQQDRWIGLAGFPDQTEVRFALPIGVDLVSGELNLVLDSQLAEGGDGRVSISVNGVPRGQIVLNDGAETHEIAIALEAADLLGPAVNLRLASQGTTSGGQICPVDTANNGSAIALNPQSELVLVTAAESTDPEIELFTAAEPFEVLLGDGAAQARAIWGTQRLQRDGIAAVIGGAPAGSTRLVFAGDNADAVSRNEDGSLALAGETGPALLVQARGNDAIAAARPTAWPVRATALTAETGVRNFRGSKRWTLDYKLADLPLGMMPTRLDLALKTSELVAGSEWVVRVSLNNNLLETRRFDGKIGDIALPIALPIERQGLVNSIQIELVDTSPNDSICRAAPDAQAQLLPETKLTAGEAQPVDGWGATVRQLAAAPSIDLTVEGALDAAGASRAAAMLGQFLPVRSTVTFGDDASPIRLTVVDANAIGEAMRLSANLGVAPGSVASKGQLLVMSSTSLTGTDIAVHRLEDADSAALASALKRDDVAILVQY